MLSKLSVKKPYTVIVGILLVIVLGYISFQKMSTDLLPSMNLPYVVVYTTYPGATPEQVEGDVTRPMEAAFATLTDIKKLTSQSRDNVSVVIMQFNDGANMDTALIEISSRLDQLKGAWSDDVGSPVALKLNPDMLPVAILSVRKDDADILGLSEYVEDELVPAFEALNGVASATASGVITQEIDVTIEQSRIDVVNSAILESVDKELAKAEKEINEAQAAISEGRRQLAQGRAKAYKQLDEAEAALNNGETQMTQAIQDLTAQRTSLKARRDGLADNLAAMEAAMNMSDGDREALKLAAEHLAGLKAQKAALEARLASLESSDELLKQRRQAQSRRDALVAERDAQLDYIEDLKLMDAGQLNADITRINEQISDAEADLRTERESLASMTAQRDQLKAQVADLEARAAGGDATDAPATGAPSTDAPSTDGPSTDAPPTGEPDGDVTGEPTEPATPKPDEDPTDKPEDAPTEKPEEGETDAPTDKPPEGAPEGAPAEGKREEAPEGAPEEEKQEDTPEDKREDIPEDDRTTEASGEGEAARRPGGALAEDAAPEALAEQLAGAKRQLQAMEKLVTALEDGVREREAAVEALKQKRAAKQKALDTLTEGADVSGRIAAARDKVAELEQGIAALDGEIAALDAEMAGASGDVGQVTRELAAVEAEIQALEASGAGQAGALAGDPAVIRSQYAQAKAGLEEMDAGIAQMDATLEKLNDGIIPGGYIEGIDEDTKLTEAREKLVNARSQVSSALSKAQSALNEADDKVAKARKEFYEKRDEALEEAGLDGVITVQTVAGLIGGQNISMPAGYVHDQSGDQVLVRVGDKFGSIDALKRMKLFNLDLDTIDEVRLLDVASVALTDDREDTFTKLDGQDGILLSLEKQSTYSTADVADTVLKKVAELQEQHPELHIVDLMNQGEYIDVVVSSVLNNLLSGGGLAILILLLFLLDWRPTLTVAFSIPISVVMAFVCMYFSGITLNVLSLSGLSLGIGMLVDNSIVSIENIYRLHDEEGYPLLRACVEGVKSVSGALLSSTLTTICVFLPIVFVKGMARDLFEDMGLSIAYSLLASLFVAMTVVPMMCSYLMRHSKPRKHRLFSAFQRGYCALLRGALRVKPLVLLAALALMVFSGMQVTRMGISFMPEVNSRQMSATLTPDSEMSKADQQAQAARIMDDMMAVKGVKSIGLMDGSGTVLTMGSSGGSFSYYIIVDETAGVRNVEIAREMTAIGEKYGADLAVQASTMDISMMTGSGISVEITGDDIETLQSIAKDIAAIAEATEGVTDVNDGLEEAVPEKRIVVDREKAIDEGLTAGQILQFIAQKLAGKAEVGKVTLDGRELTIQLIEGRNSGLRPEDLQDLEIEVEKESESRMVRIGDVSDIRNAASLATIHRASQRRMVTVSFDIAEGYSANLVSDDFAAKLKEYQLPGGYKATLAGENETVMAIMGDLLWMILVAVLLIFLIMVAQFQSFKSPIIVMFTIPLAFTGGLLALILTGMDLSIVAMLGFLVLSGVVVNNGIVFIDCVNQLRIAGMQKRDALVEAGRQRLRPILMTALTTILGMSTMALGQGTGAEMMQPMAVVSVGGLTYATLMTLFVVPVLYDLLNGRNMKAREIQMIREAAGMNGGDIPGLTPPPPPPAVPAPASTPEPPPPPERPVITEVASDKPEPPPLPVFARPSKPAKPITVRLKK